MTSSKPENTNNVYESFIMLVQVIRYDREIRTRVKQLLQMDHYHRRSLLNSWLEKLQSRHAPENLLNALTCLFDDKIAQKVLALINNHKI